MEVYFMSKLVKTLENKALAISSRSKAAVSNQRGDFYISDAVKVIIAVVLGALLLAAITAIFNDTILPRITVEIRNLFG